MLTPVNNERYISVKADGRFSEKVNEGDEGAELYTWNDKKTGEEKSKWVRRYKSVDNVFITNIRFETGEYGENILLTLSDGENEVVWSEGTSTNFGTDLMKKLPNVDFSAKVSIQPYAFPTENGKEKKGVSIFQNDKITDFFWDGKENLHGFPVRPKEMDAMDSDDWKVFFIEVKKFLTNYTKENIVPKFAEGIEQKDVPVKNIPQDDGSLVLTDEDIAGIPF